MEASQDISPGEVVAVPPLGFPLQSDLDVVDVQGRLAQVEVAAGSRGGRGRGCGERCGRS